MTNTKEIAYSKACVELNEIIKHLSKEEQNKIPKYFKDNLIANIDTEYRFTFDSSKSILEQNYMNETMALFINMYRAYFTQKDAEVWNKYDKICTNMIEKEKREKYNPNDIFKKEEIKPKQPVIEQRMVIYKENIFRKFINKIKQWFKIK